MSYESGYQTGQSGPPSERRCFGVGRRCQQVRGFHDTIVIIEGHHHRVTLGVAATDELLALASVRTVSPAVSREMPRARPGRRSRRRC